MYVNLHVIKKVCHVSVSDLMNLCYCPDKRNAVQTFAHSYRCYYRSSDILPDHELYFYNLGVTT